MYGRLYKAVCVCLYTVIMRRIGGAGAALVVRPPSHAAPCYRKAHYIWELTAGHLVCYSISIGFRNCEVLCIVTRWTCFKSDLMKPVCILGGILVNPCSMRESVRIVRRMFRVWLKPERRLWSTSTARDRLIVYFYLPVTQSASLGRALSAWQCTSLSEALATFTTVNFVVMHKTMCLYGTL